MVAACVLVFIIVTAVHHDFADIANLQVIGLDLADYGILAVGVSMVIITSGIDLSPGSMVAFCSMCSAYVDVNWHWPVVFSILASLGIGMVVGFLHGWFITRLDVPPFAITLVTLTAAAGGALALTQGQPISGVSTFYDKLTLYDAFQVPIPVVIFVVVAFLAWVLMERTYIGRQIYAVGGNREAARLAGIPDQPPADADLHRQRRLRRPGRGAGHRPDRRRRPERRQRLGTRRDRRLRHRRRVASTAARAASSARPPARCC